MKYILVLSALVGVVALEVCAQTSSSASQTVTFGVRRIAPVLLASLQTSSALISVSGSERTSLLKVTVSDVARSNVGSDVRSRNLDRSGLGVSPTMTAGYFSANMFSSYNNTAIVSATESLSLNSSLSPRSVVTLTE